MKYLKLNSEYKECHGLARALVGSRIYENGCQLTAILGDKFLCVDSPDDVCKVWELCKREINIPLDTLKLCPYVAMRENLKICFSGYVPRCGYWIEKPIHWLNGIVHELGVDISEAKLTLDLDKLPKGAEIVENFDD